MDHLPGAVLAAADRNQAVVAAARDLACATTSRNARSRAQPSRSARFVLRAQRSCSIPSASKAIFGRVSRRDADLAVPHAANSSRKILALREDRRGTCSRCSAGAACRSEPRDAGLCDTCSKMGLVVEQRRAHLRIAVTSRKSEDRRVEADLARLSRTLSGRDAAHGVAQDGLGAARLGRGAGRNAMRRSSNRSRSRNGERFSIEKYMALRSSSCRITGTALVEELVEHAVAQQLAGVAPLGERLLTRSGQVARRTRRRPGRCGPRKSGSLDEELGIPEKRIAHDRGDVLVPGRQRCRVQRPARRDLGR